MGKLGRISLLLLAGLAWLVFHSQTVRAASWTQAAFGGRQVSLVRVNQSNPNQMLAVVEGKTYVSISGGVLWDQANLPLAPSSIAYDPVRPGTVYAGTAHGMYVSDSRGLIWRPFVPNQFGIVLDMVAGRDYVFATITQSGNATPQILRLTRNGSSEALSKPDVPNPGPLAYDNYNQALYLAGDDTVDRSLDNGSSWTRVGPLFQVGRGSIRLQVKNGLLVQLSWNTGPFVTRDGGANWQRLVDRSNTREMFYLFHSFTGLTVNHGHVFYGLYSYDAGTQDMYEADGSGNVTKLGLDQLVLDVATGDQQLWAATANGLWVNLDLVSSEAQVQRPVIILPGVVGSWKVGGQYILDPIMHTYDPLLKMLRNAGYVEGLTLFPFGYEWRQDNNVTAGQLATKIAQVRKICGCAQVDLVGHSMGGLVARAYIEGDNYAGDVANLIELGTPNAGAVESYAVWEAGVSSQKSRQERLVFHLMNLLAYEHGYTNIFDYAHNEVPSTQQLLPVFNYIDGRSYPHNYPANPFLEQLNSPENVVKLKSRTHLVLIGSDTLDTLSRLQVKDSSNADRWQHGEIVGKTYGPGDGTVPFHSFTAIAPADLVLDSEHGALAKKPDGSVLNYLMTDFARSQPVTTNNPTKLLLVYVKSPVKMTITDEHSNELSDSSSSIPGSFYTGSDDEVQFATIPDPTEHYAIALTGTAAGNYTLGVNLIDDDDETDQELTGQTTSGQVDGYEWYGSDLKLTSTTAAIAIQEEPQAKANDGETILPVAANVDRAPVQISSVPATETANPIKVAVSESVAVTADSIKPVVPEPVVVTPAIDGGPVLPKRLPASVVPIISHSDVPGKLIVAATLAITLAMGLWLLHRKRK